MMCAAGVVPGYLDMLDEQLRQMAVIAEGAAPAALWQRPGPRRWSAGEALDHTQRLNRSLRRLLVVAAPLLRPWARRRRGKPYCADIDNVYARPNFPASVGWLWPPRHTPARPVSAGVLIAELAAEHGRIRRWYESQDEAVLGHTNLYDPAIGWVNFVQALRIGVYHDAHHFRAAAGLLGHAWEDVPTG